MLKVSSLLLIGLAALCLLSSPIEAAKQPEVSIEPRTNNGKKWRIGYIEGGPYQDYQSVLKTLIQNLIVLGWIEKTPFPQTRDEHETQTIWSWLAADVQSDYLDFVADAYWSAGWDEEVRKKNKQTVISRLNTKKDIDLMLTFGTWAGLDMANNLHSVSTMVLSSSNPIRSGIIKSAEDSGYDHIHARVDPTRFERQIRLFHGVVGFKKLGLAFEDTPTGRTYVPIEVIEKLASELGFEIFTCHAPDEIPDILEREKRLIECYQKLAPHVDAFYMTAHNALTLKTLPEVLVPLFKYKVATFAQRGAKEVKHGVLMSMAQQDFQHLGRFHAETFAQILNGAKPRNLPQIFEEPLAIAINLETARRIGFRFPLDILAGAKKIYEHIERIED
jgi:ABC-type uncharacterized transport system substrate-binding protein